VQASLRDLNRNIPNLAIDFNGEVERRQARIAALIDHNSLVKQSIAELKVEKLSKEQQI